MEYRAFLIKYAEIALKGKNRYLFENALVDQIRRAIRDVEGDLRVRKEQGRIYVECHSDAYDYEECLQALQRVFGIVGICPVVILEDQGFDQLTQDVLRYMESFYPDESLTFKVNARRARKAYPLQSMEINARLGEAILDAFPKTKVDVHHPKLLLNVEVREKIYVYSQEIPGLGGMPAGCNGKAMLLLSGGIDSPVSSYMIAKRGVRLELVHFFSPPYTSAQAKEKVVQLARELAPWCGRMTLHVIPFTQIQEEIRRACPEDHFTLIMRRFMMRLAEAVARRTGAKSLVTGECLGQVASQTMDALTVSDDVCTLPVLRPVIGMDKEEIVRYSRKIGTFETSILPYEDCCTVFTPRHPRTHPVLEEVREYEAALDVEGLMQKALEGVERIKISMEAQDVSE